MQIKNSRNYCIRYIVTVSIKIVNKLIKTKMIIYSNVYTLRIINNMYYYLIILNFMGYRVEWIFLYPSPMHYHNSLLANFVYFFFSSSSFSQIEGSKLLPGMAKIELIIGLSQKYCGILIFHRK
jgi:hypothetical protein